MSKCEPELLVSKVVKVVHDQWVLVTLVNWHVDNSALSVTSYHFFDVFNALEVNMHTLNLLTHQLREHIEGGESGRLRNLASNSLELFHYQIFIVEMNFFVSFCLLEEFVEPCLV